MKIIVVFFLAITLCAVSCRKWENPATSIVSADKSVAVLVMNPSVYTMQEVRVMGKVWEISKSEDSNGTTTFKLADSDGNHIMVNWKQEVIFSEQDVIEAEGLFDSNYISSESRFAPVLLAKRIRILKTK